MCLILFAYQVHASYPLIVAANRDENFSRPTRMAQFWPEHPSILAGKDLQAGGLWLGITRSGRFAALTNYRDPAAKPGNISRGLISKEFLLGEQSPENFLHTLSKNSNDYSGFNLLIGDNHGLFYYSNRDGSNASKRQSRLEPGVYGLSNHLINTPWPKITRGKQLLQKHLENPSKDLDTDALIALLQDKTVPPDDTLPDTGIGLDYERILSPLFIQAPFYGTRSSSALTLSAQGKVTFHEQCYGEKGVKADHSVMEFQLEVQ